MLQTPFKFDILSEAIEEAHRFEERTDFPCCRVTEEEDGSYTFYGHGKKVYDTNKVKYH